MVPHPFRSALGAHPASYSMVPGLSRWVGGWGLKSQRHGLDHPPLSSSEVKERIELYLYSPSGLSWSVLG
jgi:hypothetical protein